MWKQLGHRIFNFAAGLFGGAIVLSILSLSVIGSWHAFARHGLGAGFATVFLVIPSFYYGVEYFLHDDPRFKGTDIAAGLYYTAAGPPIELHCDEGTIIPTHGAPTNIDLKSDGAIFIDGAQVWVGSFQPQGKLALNVKDIRIDRNSIVIEIAENNVREFSVRGTYRYEKRDDRALSFAVEFVLNAPDRPSCEGTAQCVLKR